MRIIGNKILVLRNDLTKEYNNLIVATDEVGKTKRGTVIEIGQDTGVAVGDTVLYTPWGGWLTEIKGILYEIVDCEDLIGVLAEGE